MFKSIDTHASDKSHQMKDIEGSQYCSFVESTDHL